MRSAGGYSVLGWNHPGFGGSTVKSVVLLQYLHFGKQGFGRGNGKKVGITKGPFVSACLQGVPFPQNEANAMDVVIQFAVHKLGFQLPDIVIYAWSIGGFTGSAAASRL